MSQGEHADGVSDRDRQPLTQNGKDKQRYNETNFHDSHAVSVRPDAEAEAIAGRPARPRPKDETDFHDSYVGHTNQSWLATQDKSLDRVVSVERIRDENRDVYAALMVSTGESAKVRILRTIVARRGVVTYDDLNDHIGDVTTRTIKSKVADLRDAGILDVGDGRPAAIGFADDDVALLVEDTLAYLD